MLTKKQIKTLHKSVLHRRWFDGFKRLVLFRETFKRWPKQNEEYPKGIRVGQWVTVQKSVYAKDKMLSWRRQLLQSIGLPWAKPNDWWEKYQKYDEWYKKNKRIPLVHSTSKIEKSLAAWRLCQRSKLYSNLLDQQQIAALTEAGVFENYDDLKWNSKFDQVKNFVTKTGRLPVRHSKNAYEADLALWRHYNLKLLKNGKLPYKKAVAFRNLIENASPQDINWNKTFEEITAFLRINNRFPSTASKDKKEVSLAKWKEFQQERLSNSVMATERARSFRAAGLDQSVYDLQRHKKVAELLKFTKKSHRLPYRNSKDKSERSLAIWAEDTSKRKDLNKKFVEKLHAILSDNNLSRIDKREIRWEKNYKETSQYIKKYQRYPSAKSKDTEERKIGSWIKRQRDLYRKNSIDENKIKRLKEIGVI